MLPSKSNLSPEVPILPHLHQEVCLLCVDDIGPDDLVAGVVHLPGTGNSEE